MLDFRYFLEILDAFAASVDNIELQDYGNYLQYHFKVDNLDYVVYFARRGIDRLTDDAYGISFKGPQGFALTKLGKGPTVYRHLIKAVKKLLESKKPEGLSFTGYGTDQDVIYQSFYEKYLSKLYTKVNKEDYIRNDLLEKWQSTNDPRYQIAMNYIDNLTSNSIFIAKQKRIDQRKKIQTKQNTLQNTFATLNHAVGKIAYDSFNNLPIYISRVSNNGFIEGLSMRFNKVVNTKVGFDNIKPFDQQKKAEIQEVIERFSNILNSGNILANGVWEI